MAKKTSEKKRRAVIVGGARTPFVKAFTDFTELSTIDLGVAAVRGLLERTGLAPFVDRQAGKLSGGMKQKLAVTAALLPNPRNLILDEPTAGVDVELRKDMWQLVRSLRASATMDSSIGFVFCRVRQESGNDTCVSPFDLDAAGSRGRGGEFCLSRRTRAGKTEG